MSTWKLIKLTSKLDESIYKYIIVDVALHPRISSINPYTQYVFCPDIEMLNKGEYTFEHVISESWMLSQDNFVLKYYPIIDSNYGFGTLTNTDIEIIQNEGMYVYEQVWKDDKRNDNKIMHKSNGGVIDVRQCGVMNLTSNLK